MTKDFEERLMRRGVAETKNYHYRLNKDKTGLRIERIKIELFGTNKAPANWEVVKYIKFFIEV